MVVGMGLLRHQPDEPVGERFQMREKLLSIGDDYWIEDDQGRRAYKVNGKAVRIRDTFVLEDAAGNEAASIQERKLSIRDKVDIERGGDTAATVHKALVGLRDRFAIDVKNGADLKAHGNIVDHEYEIERDGRTVATISKKWFRVRESYGVEVAQGEDVPLILAITVAIDSLT
ncbi:LURP-one-related/scramblase family protein [Arthrobacter ginkgonis]|uniref:LURP-one-related/scramblase family protein n=1 Tax=Arthrobacter ginkgonis TaxID=1630594 RepID=A0ABP7CBB3_9MICC